MLFCAATTYRLLLQDPELERKYDLGSLRACVSAGEPLPAPVYDEWLRRTGIEILDGIGSTEMFHIFISSSPGAARARIDRACRCRATRPGSSTTRCARCRAGRPARLAVRGPTGCRYWRKPDRQRDYVREGWNLTGDIYVEDADGYFWYQCRNDDLIICGGYNIAGPEIESVLIEHPAVLEAAVVATPDADARLAAQGVRRAEARRRRIGGARRSAAATT